MEQQYKIPPGMTVITVLKRGPFHGLVLSERGRYLVHVEEVKTDMGKQTSEVVATGGRAFEDQDEAEDGLLDLLNEVTRMGGSTKKKDTSPREPGPGPKKGFVRQF